MQHHAGMSLFAGQPLCSRRDVVCIPLFTFAKEGEMAADIDGES